MGMYDELGSMGDESWVKEDCVARTLENSNEIADLINKLYAEKKQALLIVLQGMDASGKDGVTKDVLATVSSSW